MTDSEDQATLIALVVEDNKSVLAARSALLQTVGFVPVPVDSYRDALKEFRSIPRVDMVLTDINLPADARYGATDTSGVTLAQVLRAVSSDLPIYGYSAMFAEGQVSPELCSAFTAYYPKGRLDPDEQIQAAESWKLAAQRHRTAREGRAEADLRRLRESHQELGRNFLTARELMPASRAGQGEGSVEEILATAGYRIKLIEPGGCRPRLDGGEANTAGPIVLWMKSEPTTTVAEVYGFPDLYGHGPTEERAIADVLLLMDGYLEDLRLSDPHDLSEDLVRLRRYLLSVFGE